MSYLNIARILYDDDCIKCQISDAFSLITVHTLNGEVPRPNRTAWYITRIIVKKGFSIAKV
jgi:hypothetical protein